MQSYDYQKNDAYATGSQSFDAAVGPDADARRGRCLVLGWGGLTVLGAVDSLPLGVTEPPERKRNRDAGQGVSEGPRFYDYGPGATFGAPPVSRRSPRCSRCSSTRGVISTRWTACAPTTSCSAGVWTCCCRCAARSASAHRRVFRSSDLLPGRRDARREDHYPQFARISRGAASEPRLRALGALRCCRSPGRPPRSRSPRLQAGATREAAGVEAGSWPAARSRPCAATVQTARRTSPTGTAARPRQYRAIA